MLEMTLTDEHADNVKTPKTLTLACGATGDPAGDAGFSMVVAGAGAAFAKRAPDFGGGELSSVKRQPFFFVSA